MSFYYVSSNGEDARKLYIKRNIYRNKLLGYTTKYRNITDFYFGEKFLYGRVNRFFTPITFNNSALRLKKFNSSITQSPSLSAVNFVVDAFNGLAQQFEKCAMQGLISTDDPYLSKLKVYKAYLSPEQAYDKQWRSYVAVVKAAFMEKDIKVKNFDELIKELMVMLDKSAPTIAFTQTAYTKSRRCSILTSGLAVEIANISCASDEAKINSFINSSNWEFYVNACNSYGFMIDLSAPWRLVADIGSQFMIDSYANRYGISSTNQILETAYGYTHGIYYNKFKYYLLELYNAVTPNTHYTVLEECNGRTITRFVQPVRYTIDSLEEKYSEQYFLKLYCQIRFLEEESEFKDHEMRELITDTINLATARDLGSALEKFERILNKTFDYSGSLGYHINHRKAKRDAEDP